VERGSTSSARHPGAGEGLPARGGLLCHHLQPVHPRDTRATRPLGCHQPQRRALVQCERRSVATTRHAGPARQRLLHRDEHCHVACIHLEQTRGGCTPASPRRAATATPSHCGAGTIQPSSQTPCAVCVCAASASTSLRDTSRGYAPRTANPAGPGGSGSASRRSGWASSSLSAHRSSRGSPPHVTPSPAWGFAVVAPRRALPLASPAGRLLKAPTPQSFTRSCTPFSPARVDNSLKHARPPAWFPPPPCAHTAARGCPHRRCQPLVTRGGCRPGLAPERFPRDIWPCRRQQTGLYSAEAAGSCGRAGRGPTPPSSTAAL
jgi:hypothetical protein